MLSNDDREALTDARRELTRNARSRRTRSGRSNKQSHLMAYSMWVVLGALLITIGIMGGLAYVRERDETARDTAEAAVKTKEPDTEAAAKPAAKPKPVAAKRDPESERRKREEERRKREAETPKPKPKPTGPRSLEDAGGSEAGQQAMLDRSRAVVARSEEMTRSGVLTDEDRDNVSGLMRRGRAILASWTAACEDKRWDDVMRHTREKNANTDKHESYLNGAERRQREALRKATEAAEREEAERKARALPPAVQNIHDLLGEAVKGREASLATKSRVRVRDALNKTLARAWSLTSGLKGSDRGHQTGLRILIHNSRGECHEVLAKLARHRRIEVVMKNRIRIQGHAVVAYEKTLKLGGDAVYPSGISATAWALHRIAVLSAKIAQYHTERQADYLNRGKVTYPQTTSIYKFRNKSQEAIARLKADYPKATDASGRLLFDIIEE